MVLSVSGAAAPRREAGRPEERDQTSPVKVTSKFWGALVGDAM